jgi:hypothetical protein
MRNRYARLAAAASLVILFGGAGLSAAQAAPGAAQRASQSGGTWGNAADVPGLGQLNSGGLAQISAISCPAPGDCGAGGFYYARAGSDQQAFVVSERNGTWGKAIEVPGLRRLNAGGYAQVDSLSCATPGYCSAAGTYADAALRGQAFVVTETNGVWGRAIETPGSARLNTGGQAEVFSVSCSAPGDCGAGGYYTDSGQTSQAFVVTETNGVWERAIEVPGSARLHDNLGAEVDSLSCAKPGYCSLGGDYLGGSGSNQAFVATQRRGAWGKAIEVPGSARLNTGGQASVDSISCAAPGDCSAGGSYQPNGQLGAAFVVTESSGRWGKAIEVPRSAWLNAGGNAGIDSVSCARPGYCSAGGIYEDAHKKYQAFVVTQWGGRWGKAIEVHGSAGLNAGGDAGINSVSCAAPGDCSAGGFYKDADGRFQAFVVSESGRWGSAIEVPGSAHLNSGGEAEVIAVSCPAPRRCGAGGQYTATSGVSRSSQAFVVTQR